MFCFLQSVWTLTFQTGIFAFWQNHFIDQGNMLLKNQNLKISNFYVKHDETALLLESIFTILMEPILFIQFLALSHCIFK